MDKHRHCHKSGTLAYKKASTFFIFLGERWLHRLRCQIYFGRYSSAIYLFSFHSYQNHKAEYHIKVCISYSGDMIFLTPKCPGALNLSCIHLNNWKKELCSGCLKMKTAGSWRREDTCSSLCLVSACGAHNPSMKNEFCGIFSPLLQKIEVWTWRYFPLFYDIVMFWTDKF